MKLKKAKGKRRVGNCICFDNIFFLFFTIIAKTAGLLLFNLKNTTLQVTLPNNKKSLTIFRLEHLLCMYILLIGLPKIQTTLTFIKKVIPHTPHTILLLFTHTCIFHNLKQWLNNMQYSTLNEY